MKKLAFVFLIAASCSAAEPTPTPTPDKGNEKPQWLIAASTDSTQMAGVSPTTTYFISKHKVLVRQLSDGSYLITFEP